MGKNKVSQKTIVAIVMMLMLLISTLKLNTYARTELDVLPLPENEGYWFLTEVTTKSGQNQGDKQYYYYTSNKKMYYNPTSGDIEGQEIKYYRLITKDTEWEFRWETDKIRSEKINTENTYYKYEIIRSNFTIYYINGETVFFSVLTQVDPLTQMTPLIRGISPFLIGLLIALVGFWKAWQFLFKTLRKA